MKKIPWFESVTDALAGGGLAIIVWLSPLPFGSVQGWARMALLILAMVVLASCLARSAAGRGKKIPSGILPLLGFILLGLAVAVFQLIPLPQGLVRLLDPAAARWWQAAGRTGPWTLSLAPSLTRADLGLGLTALAVFVSLLIFSPSRRSRQGFLSLLIAGLLGVAFSISLAGIILRSSAPGTILGLHSLHHGNPFGPFVNRNHFAGYAGMTVPVGLALILARPRRGGNPAILRIFSHAGRTDLRPFLLAFMTMVIAAAVLLAGSRGGVISLVGGILFLAWLCRRAGLLSRGNLLRLVGGIVLAAGAFWACFGWANLAGRFAAGQEIPVRFLLWRDTIQILKDFPLFGTGLGTFAEIFPSYRSFASGYTYTHAENDYLQFLAELGVGGLICLAGALTVTIRKIMKTAGRIAIDRPLSFVPRFRCGRAALFLGAAAGAATLVFHGLFNFNFHIPANLVIFSALAAVALASGDNARPGEPSRRAGRILLTAGNILLRALTRLFYRWPSPDPKAILVWRTGNLGDSWCALPALGAIARRFPQARLVIATAAAAGSSPHSARVFAEIGGFSDFLIYHPEKLRSLGGIRRLRNNIRQNRFGLAVYLGQSSAPLGRIIRDLLFLRLAGIPTGVGFRWNKAILGGRALPSPPGQQPDETTRLLGLLAPLGITEQEISWPAAAATGLLPSGNGILVGLHPTAKFPAKRWGNKRMLETARLLAGARPDIRFVIVGDASAGPFARSVRASLGSERVIDLAGKTSFPELASVLARVDLLVSPDSGPVHVAAAAGTPVVGIYSSRDLPGAWHPHGEGHIVLRTDPPCSGCLRTSCPRPVCLDEILPAQAAAAALEILARTENT